MLCRNEALHVGEHDLQVVLKSLHNELDTVALHPEPSRMVRQLCLDLLPRRQQQQQQDNPAQAHWQWSLFD